MCLCGYGKWYSLVGIEMRGGETEIEPHFFVHLGGVEPGDAEARIKIKFSFGGGTGDA